MPHEAPRHAYPPPTRKRCEHRSARAWSNLSGATLPAVPCPHWQLCPAVLSPLLTITLSEPHEARTRAPRHSDINPTMLAPSPPTSALTLTCQLVIRMHAERSNIARWRGV
ncbi:MAG: hypothetical protein WDW38_006839 [Sanguina aurantia]